MCCFAEQKKQKVSEIKSGVDDAESLVMFWTDKFTGFLGQIKLFLKLFMHCFVDPKNGS